MEGVNGLLVATDVRGIGHYTEYPSDKETVALQLPFRDGNPPAHIVLHRGACRGSRQLRKHSGNWSEHKLAADTKDDL